MTSDKKKSIILVRHAGSAASKDEEAVRRLGYDVAVASTSQEALALALACNMNCLILMDIDPGPEFDGVVVAKQILEKRRLPIVFLASQWDRATADRLLGIHHHGLVTRNSGEVILQASIAIAFDLFDMQSNTESTAEAFRASEERYRSILMASPDDITITDLQGRILDVSPAALPMFGFEREGQGRGRLVTEFLVPEDGERAMATVARLLQGVKSGPSEYRGVRGNGDIFDIEVHSEIIRGVDGRPTGLMIIVRDITDRKRSEVRIRKLLAEKELLLKEVHHRITNNMSTVRALLSLQASELKDPVAREALNDAAGRVLSMLQLYNKLYRSESFSELSTADYLSTLLDEIVANFPNRALVSIETHLEPFLLDAKRLSSLGIIVNELITNIMKYAFTGRDKGLITVSATMRDKHATVTVKDDGIGIAESIDFGSSTGFGLELVRMLTEQLGGTIRVERDNGTRWTLEFEV
jgi:PAS domain S-box-containing protein